LPRGLLFFAVVHYNDSYRQILGREVSIMPEGLTYLLVFIALVVVYTIAKVISYMRQSERQWEQVDKSKLKKWDDDEDD
jgi:hypothetical protein